MFKKLVGSLCESCFDTDEIMNGAREKCEVSPLNLWAVHDQNAKSTRFGTDEIMNGAREKCEISPLNLWAVFDDNIRMLQNKVSKVNTTSYTC